MKIDIYKIGFAAVVSFLISVICVIGGILVFGNPDSSAITPMFLLAWLYAFVILLYLLRNE